MIKIKISDEENAKLKKYIYEIESVKDIANAYGWNTEIMNSYKESVSMFYLQYEEILKSRGLEEYADMNEYDWQCDNVRKTIIINKR